jgi:hypothetical protein
MGVTIEQVRLELLAEVEKLRKDFYARIEELSDVISRTKSVQPQKPTTTHSEMTTDQYFASKNADRLPPRGPVPLTEDGRCIDPTWRRNGDTWEHLDREGKIDQRVAA